MRRASIWAARKFCTLPAMVAVSMRRWAIGKMSGISITGGTDFRTGWGQILRLDSPGGAWEVDLDMGPYHLRPEVLREVTLRTDENGTALVEPVTLLLAGAYSRGLNTVTADVFTRDDRTEKWVRTAIFSGPTPGGENYSMRDIHVHRDRITGVDRIFVTVGIQGVFSGVYDPALPGRIRWGDEARVRAIEGEAARNCDGQRCPFSFRPAGTYTSE